MTATRTVWFFVLALTLVRLSILAATDLEFDEAHYWMWSERLAPAYFSKGPGIAFVIRASTAVFGSTEFGVRFFSPILAAGTSLLLFYFGKKLFGATAALWAVIAANVTPLFTIGSFLMTIDPLSIFFWLAAMFTFWLALEQNSRASVGDADSFPTTKPGGRLSASPTSRFTWFWPLTGLLVGLGFLCKYTNAFEILSIVLVLTLAPRWRREFARPGLYLLLGVFALCMIPPIIWNHQHAWITLEHLRARGGVKHGFGFHLLEPLKFFAQHLLSYSPLLVLGVAWAVIALSRRATQQLKVLFLFWFGLPVFLFYLLLSFNSAAAPNWDAPAMVSFGLLAAYFWRDRLETSRALRICMGVALFLGLLMSVIIFDTDLIRTAGIKLWRSDPSDRMRGWKSATAAFEQIRQDVETRNGEKVFLIADARDRASEISFYLREKRPEGPGHPPIYIPESQNLVNQFSFWPRYDEFVEAQRGSPQPEAGVYTEENGINPFMGRSALFVREGRKRRAPRKIRASFESTEEVGIIEVQRYGKVIRKWQVFLCRNYRTLPL